MKKTQYAQGLPHTTLKMLAFSLFLISGLTLLSTLLSPSEGWKVKTPYTILLEGEEGAPPSPPPETISPPPEQQGPPPEGMPPEGAPPQGDQGPPPEGMPPQREQPPQMTAEQMYQQLPAEVINAGVSLSDIQSLYSMGITDPATMHVQIGNLIAEKMAPQGVSEGMQGMGPPSGEGGQAPPCNSPEECQAYCSDPAHAQECQGMGPGGQQGEPFGQGMEPQQGEQGGEMREGPGGCKSMSECIAYCKDPAHREECGRKGPPEKKKGGPPEGMIPDRVPQEVVDAGATQEFLEVICSNMKWHMECDFLGAVDAAKENFSQAGTEIGMTFDFSNLEALKALVRTRIDAMCNSTQDNFGTNMKTFMEFVNSGIMDSAMEGIGGQVEDFMMQKAQIIESQMGNPEEIGRQMQALGDQMRQTQDPVQQQALQAQMNELQQKAQQMQSTGQEMQALGNKMEQIFGNMEQKMEASMQANKLKPECQEMEKRAVEAELALNYKMLDFGLKMVEEQEIELRKYGIEVEELAELKAWLMQQREKIKTVFAVGATDEAKFAFVKEMQDGMAKWEREIPKAIIKELAGTFVPRAKENIEKYRLAAKYAKSIGKNNEAKLLNELANEIEDYVVAVQEKLKTAFTQKDLEDLKLYFIKIFNADKEAREIYDALKEA
ncbi:MAG: hypothetical protein AB1467_05820 [Candidatus Diapherotrites archaeon]